jgi:hypothetical protein
VSLGSRDRYVLNAITDHLAASDPELAGLLGSFTRRTAGEQMPAQEQIRARWRRVPCSARGLLLWLGPGRVLMLLWLLVTAAMISMAVALSSGGAPSCNALWVKACPATTVHAGPP